jgi:DNA polymerase-3 subunit chi
MEPCATRVDFYLLPTAEPRERLVWVCRLAEKAYRAGHHVHIHCRDSGETNLLDDLLWSFRASSFVPHLRLGAQPQDADTPVSLGYGEQQPGHGDVLLNLDNGIPAWSSRFQRIAELVPQLPEQRLLSREHYRQYKALGCELQTHDLESAPPLRG